MLQVAAVGLRSRFEFTYFVRAGDEERLSKFGPNFPDTTQDNLVSGEKKH